MLRFNDVAINSGWGRKDPRMTQVGNYANNQDNWKVYQIPKP